MEHGLILSSTSPATASDSRRRSNYLSDNQQSVWWLPRIPFSRFASSVTCWIMIVQVVIFFASIAVSNGFAPPAANSTFGPTRCALIQVGGKFSPFIVHKLEYWRIISANFVHSGVITLILSLILEYLIVMPVEIEHGRLITLAVLLLSGVTGYAFSAVASPTSVSTGALGSVMGVVGFRLSYAVLDWPSISEEDRRRTGILEAGTAFIILIVGQSPFVDNYSSFAAFIIGCFFGGAFFGDKIDNTIASQRIVTAMALMATVFVLFIVGFLLGAGEFPLIHHAVYSLICSISNTMPRHPVVAIPTGLVYEKSLIEKSIDENGVCPITKVPLRRSDLISLKTDEPHINPPRALEGASIPALLASFQNEWDATALEMFKLRQTLDKTRKELAQALYQHDAACRVIARLVKERDEARNALATVSAAPNGEKPLSSLTPLSEAETKKINEVASTLMGSRSAKRKSMTGVGETFSWRPHQLSKNEGDSLCLDLDDNADAAAIGSKNGLVKIIVRSSGKQEREHQLGNADITRVKFVHDNTRTVLALASDKTARVLSRQGETKMALGSIPTDCCEQATHDFGFVTEQAGTWTMFRLGTGETAAVGQDTANPGPMMSVNAHPDGKVFATGGAANGSIGIWNVLTGQLEAHLSPGDANLGHANVLDFGENGVSLAAGFSATGVVKVWDMRKADSPLHTFQPTSKANVCGVSFDPSGQTLLSAYEDGSFIVRNVVRTGEWPISFQSAGGNGMVAASPGVGSCLVLGKDGILVEWR